MNKEPVENQTPFRAELMALADPSYRDFQARLMPTVDRETILGVRMPDLRKLAKNLEQAGADIRFTELSGDHSISCWNPAMEKVLRWLAET